MYGRSRYGQNDWFKCFFFFLLGILIGQMIQLDIGIQPRDRDSSVTPIAQTEIV